MQKKKFQNNYLVYTYTESQNTESKEKYLEQSNKKNKKNEKKTKLSQQKQRSSYPKNSGKSGITAPPFARNSPNTKWASIYIRMYFNNS